MHELGPRQLRRRPDDGDARRDREHRVEVGEQRRRVPDRVLRRQDPPGGPGREPAAQRVDVDATVEREQPAHAGQREAEPDLDAGNVALSATSSA